MTNNTKKTSPEQAFWEFMHSHPDTYTFSAEDAKAMEKAFYAGVEHEKKKGNDELVDMLASWEQSANFHDDIFEQTGKKFHTASVNRDMLRACCLGLKSLLAQRGMLPPRPDKVHYACGCTHDGDLHATRCPYHDEPELGQPEKLADEDVERAKLFKRLYFAAGETGVSGIESYGEWLMQQPIEVLRRLAANLEKERAEAR